MIALKRLSTRAADFERRLQALLAFEAAQDAAVDSTVAAILEDVKSRGDAAVLEYTRRFDRTQATAISDLELNRDEMERALSALPAAQRGALEHAAARIRVYHEKQAMQSWSYTDDDGTRLGQQITALDRVGLYVPGGKAAYPSSLLMNAIPAKVAGVGEIVMVTPTPGGDRNPLVLAAAAIAGVDRAFTIGGARRALRSSTARRPCPRRQNRGPGKRLRRSGKRGCRVAARLGPARGNW